MNNEYNSIKKQRKMNLVFGLVTPAVFIVGILSGMIINDLKYEKYKDPGLQKIVEAYEIMQNGWYFGKDFENFDQVLIDNALEGMLDNGDPYTFYTPNMEEQGLSTAREGFGFSLVYYGGYRYISDVNENSPAEIAGLKVGDVLRGFYDGEVFVDFKTRARDEGIKLLNEYENNTVRFSVIREGVTSDLTITRGQYSLTGARIRKETVNNEVVVYCDINTFLDVGIVVKIKTAINAAASEGNIKRVVFDVRDNGGGYVSAATDLVNLFVPKNSKIMTYQYADGSKNSVYSGSPLSNASKIDEFAIIQNGNSASASEIFAVAMRDLVDAEIIGTKSYGKGIIQAFHQFSDGSVIRYTIAESLSPNGYSIHNVGIVPDTEIKIDSDLFFKYFGDQEVLSQEMESIITKQINYLLGTQIPTYDLALNAWQTEVGVEVEESLTRDVAQELQKRLWDEYLNINELTYQTALGV